MTRDEFRIHIMRRYPRTLDSHIEEFEDWLNEARISDRQLDILKSQIRDNNETNTFPSVGKIKQWWKDQCGGVNPQGPITSAVNGWAGRSSKEIYRRLTDLRIKQKANRLSNDEGDFIVTWDLLGYNFSSLRHAGWDESRIVSYCDKIRDAIARGEKVNYEALAKLEMKTGDERRGSMAHISSVIDMASINTMTITDQGR